MRNLEPSCGNTGWKNRLYLAQGTGDYKKEKKEQLLLNIKGLSCGGGSSLDLVTPEDALGEWEEFLRE